ncbi:MAG: hypothetical protein WBC71_07520, partial [Salaquimonas sp.]
MTRNTRKRSKIGDYRPVESFDEVVRSPGGLFLGWGKFILMRRRKCLKTKRFPSHLLLSSNQ